MPLIPAPVDETARLARDSEDAAALRLADDILHRGEVECHSIFGLGVAPWGGCRLALLARLTAVRAEAQATADMVAGDLLHRRGIAEAGKVLARRARQRELYHARKRARTGV